MLRNCNKEEIRQICKIFNNKELVIYKEESKGQNVAVMSNGRKSESEKEEKEKSNIVLVKRALSQESSPQEQSFIELNLAETIIQAKNSFNSNERNSVDSPVPISPKKEEKMTEAFILNVHESCEETIAQLRQTIEDKNAEIAELKKIN